MNIETVIAVIAAVGGLSGLVSAITTAVFKILEYKKSQKGETLEAKLDEKLEPIIEVNSLLHRENTELKAELKEIRLDTTRTQLIILMEHQPHNHDTIIKTAERYFCTLGGNWWVASEFLSWAKEEKIQLPPHLLDAIAKESSQKDSHK